MYEKSKKITMRREKSSSDLEYEKSKEQCTFKPKLIARRFSETKLFSQKQEEPKQIVQKQLQTSKYQSG